MHNIKGFIFSIIIVVITFLLSAIAAGLFADLLGLWKKPIIGSVAAFCVVVSGYISAPSQKLRVASIWLILGAVAAQILSATSPYPEDKPTLIPLYATYISGVIALLICMVWNKKNHPTAKN